jgi:hypothetical protein
MFFQQDERRYLLRTPAASTKGPQSRLKTPCVDEQMIVGSLRPNAMLPAFKTACMHIHVRTAVPLILGRPDDLLPTPAPVLSVSWSGDAYESPEG